MTQLAEVFDHDPGVLLAYEASRKSFEKFAANGADDPQPADPVDAMQLQLMRWQRAKFGDQSDERMALGVIEETTESETAADVGEAFDALGDASVYASQLCTNNRLAIGPIFKLCKDANFAAMLLNHSQGMLSQVVLKRVQKVRGMDNDEMFRIRLIGCLAISIVRCGLNAHIRTAEDVGDAVAKLVANGSKMFVKEINFNDVYLTVGGEVSQRGDGHDAIPKLTVH